MSSNLLKVGLLLGAVIGLFFLFRHWQRVPLPYFGLHFEGFPLAENELRSSLLQIGLKPDFIGYFQQWPTTPDGHQPEEMLQTLKAISAQGAVPLITWEPMFIINGEAQVIPAAEILSGHWNSFLASFSQTLAEFRQPVIIRFAHEMNLIKYHWGTTSKDYQNSPAEYCQLFRYVQNAVTAGAAKEIYWMFCPNAQPLTNINPPEQAAWNNMAAWFPGREFVDILGVDGYNWGAEHAVASQGWASSWQAPWHIFSSPLTELQQLAPDLPLFIGETACPPSGGDRSLWIAQLAGFAHERQVAGMMWFHVNKELDWRLSKENASQIMKIRESQEMPAAAQWLKNLKRQ